MTNERIGKSALDPWRHHVGRKGVGGTRSHTLTHTHTHTHTRTHTHPETHHTHTRRHAGEQYFQRIFSFWPFSLLPRRHATTTDRKETFINGFLWKLSKRAHTHSVGATHGHTHTHTHVHTHAHTLRHTRRHTDTHWRT